MIRQNDNGYLQMIRFDSLPFILSFQVSGYEINVLSQCLGDFLCLLLPHLLAAPVLLFVPAPINKSPGTCSSPDHTTPNVLTLSYRLTANPLSCYSKTPLVIPAIVSRR